MARAKNRPTSPISESVQDEDTNDSAESSGIVKLECIEPNLDKKSSGENILLEMIRNRPMSDSESSMSSDETVTDSTVVEKKKKPKSKKPLSSAKKLPTVLPQLTLRNILRDDDDDSNTESEPKKTKPGTEKGFVLLHIYTIFDYNLVSNYHIAIDMIK